MTGLTPASISLPNSSSVLHAVLLAAITQTLMWITSYR